jgi:hypothetical protein
MGFPHNLRCIEKSQRKHHRFLVYTALPPDWPEEVSLEYSEIITNIPGWEGRVKVGIISEPTSAIIGRLKPLKAEQRNILGVYLDDLERWILDLGDATAVSYTMFHLGRSRY